MKLFKKSVAYVLAFVTVLSSFTILPSGFSNMADVSAVDLIEEASTVVETNQNEITVEESTTVEISNNEIAIEEPITVENNKNETTLAQSKAEATYTEDDEEETYTEGDFTYTIINDNEVKLVSYNGTSLDVVIPDVTTGSECSELANKKVTAIGDYAFMKKGLTSVIFGKNITHIGRSAFAENKALTKLDLSVCENLRYLEDKAFRNNTAVTSIIFPDNLKTICMNVFENCDSITELNLGSQLLQIENYAFSYCDKLSTVNIKFGEVGILNSGAFGRNKNLHTINIECDGKLRIDNLAFIGNTNLKNVTLGMGVVNILDYAFKDTPNLSSIKILSENLEHMDTQCIDKSKCTIYCYENTTTHYTLIKSGFTYMNFFKTDICTTDIKVNGTSVDNFNSETKKYTAFVDNITKVNIVPTIKQTYANYKVTNENNVYTLDILDENKKIVDTYKIIVKQKAPEPKYNVIGDVTLTLDKISATKVSGNIALPKGTYRLKLALENVEFGYSKRVKDYCSVTLSEKYKGFITLDTTGGTYTFQFDTVTKKLIIRHDSYLPNEYLIGDIDTILKPVGDRPLSIGTQQLQAGTYKFKLSIGGKEYGYNKVVNDATAGSLSMDSKYTAQITLNATGGIYTFTLNTETNKLIIRHTPIDNENTTDVHISGTFNLVLNDKSETGEDLTIATGTTYLEDGCYTFKVYNYGVSYTAGAILNDSGIRTLSSKYTTPITLNATGGTYKFLFDKDTGLFAVSLLA